MAAPNLTDALKTAIRFSVSEYSIAARAAHELLVPLDAASGSYIVYEYGEASEEGVHFTVHTQSGKLLLDELQPKSKGQLFVSAGVDACRLTWTNSESWVSSISLSYSVRAVSTAGVRSTVERRLFSAAEQGNVAGVQEALASGTAVDALDENGHTALLRASLGGRATVVVALLRAGASVHACDRHGNQPVHYAALAGATPTLEALIAGGSAVDARNSDGATPLFLATFRRHADTVTALLAARADPAVADSRGNCPAHLAAAAGNAPLLSQMLLSRDERRDELSGEAAVNIHTSTAHHGAAASRAARITNERGETPLRMAVTGNHAAAFAVLLRAGAAEDAATAEAALRGATQALLGGALLVCCAEGIEVAAMRLLDAGAPLVLETAPRTETAPCAETAGAPSPSGAVPGTSATGAAVDAAMVRGPLTTAAAAGSLPLVALLLRHSATAAAAASAAGSAAAAPGATLSPDDEFEALDVAATLGHTAIVDALLDAAAARDDAMNKVALPTATSAVTGATSVTDPIKQRALHVAAGSGRTGLALVLLHTGAVAGAVDASGTGTGTALHAAASGGHTVTALTLLRHGCPLSALDGKGRSALALALLHGHEQTAFAMLRSVSEAEALAVLRHLVVPGRR